MPRKRMYQITEGDEVNSFLAAIMRELDTQKRDLLIDALQERSPRSILCRPPISIPSLQDIKLEAYERYPDISLDPKDNKRDGFIEGGKFIHEKIQSNDNEKFKK